MTIEEGVKHVMAREPREVLRAPLEAVCIGRGSGRPARVGGSQRS
jgi:hypothetical protein